MLPYIKHIDLLIKTLLQKESKEYIHEPSIFGNNSNENIQMLEIVFKQRQKQIKEGELAQIVILIQF